MTTSLESPPLWIEVVFSETTLIRPKISYFTLKGPSPPFDKVLLPCSPHLRLNNLPYYSNHWPLDSTLPIRIRRIYTKPIIFFASFTIEPQPNGPKNRRYTSILHTCKTNSQDFKHSLHCLWINYTSLNTMSIPNPWSHPSLTSIPSVNSPT